MVLLFALWGCVDAGLDSGGPPVTYTDDVAPLLQRACVRCHEHGGEMDAGVELDSWAGAYGTRIRSVCTAVGPDVVDAFADVLVPAGGGPSCGDWAVYSMPPGASAHLTRSEQWLLARWVADGGVE